ncbi:hypothetical protein L1049_010507 [Liquidambar formosana]|uniref:non-specific serine/threonine protein kinase n=1 Tax=Liquidambar formosana TaxID=63359 RepID=A0AAP0N7P1_LIQFO
MSSLHDRTWSSLDFAFNYLTGSIPVEWASLQLKFFSVVGNRLSGEIPKELGNFTSLTYLDLEANQFSGEVPLELGKLVNLETLFLSSNRLNRYLPAEFAGLRNLTDFRINDNNFSGEIPDFIRNWKQLTRLEMLASGLKGPIPSSISVLEKLTQLKITDVNGGPQNFPVLRNMTGLKLIVLRNCNISGEIPAYIWGMKSLQLLELRQKMDTVILNAKTHMEGEFVRAIKMSNVLDDKLVQKDFNIAEEAPGFVKPLVKQFNATVTNNILEIRFYWAGKGTTRFPVRGVYGPLISAISVDPGQF